MTTYTFTGLRVTKTDPDGDGKYQKFIFAESVFDVVQPDPAKSFSYNYVIDQDTQVGISSQTYSQSLEDATPDLTWDTEIAQISWGAGKVTYIFQMTGTYDAHLYVWGGDALPLMTRKADLKAFAQSITSYEQIQSGPLAEGQNIKFMDLPGVTRTQNDKIIGTSGNDVFDGGKGKDLIIGGKGNDQLSGGKGKDTLKGGAGRDLLDGGEGNDRLIGGSKADSFVFKAGSGFDRVLDFQDDIDSLQLNSDLWTGDLTAQQVVDQFASNVAGDVIFSFGTGSFVINNMVKADLVDDILINA